MLRKLISFGLLGKYASAYNPQGLILKNCQLRLKCIKKKITDQQIKNILIQVFIKQNTDYYIKITITEITRNDPC